MTIIHLKNLLYLLFAMLAEVMDEAVGFGKSLKRTVWVRTLELPYRICSVLR